MKHQLFARIDHADSLNNPCGHCLELPMFCSEANSSDAPANNVGGRSREIFDKLLAEAGLDNLTQEAYRRQPNV